MARQLYTSYSHPAINQSYICMRALGCLLSYVFAVVVVVVVVVVVIVVIVVVVVVVVVVVCVVVDALMCLLPASIASPELIFNMFIHSFHSLIDSSHSFIHASHSSKLLSCHIMSCHVISSCLIHLFHSFITMSCTHFIRCIRCIPSIRFIHVINCVSFMSCIRSLDDPLFCVRSLVFFCLCVSGRSRAQPCHCATLPPFLAQPTKRKLHTNIKTAAASSARVSVC